MAPKKREPVPPATAQEEADVTRKPALPETRRTRSMVVYVPEPSADTSTDRTMFESTAAASAPNNHKRDRKDNEEKDSESSSASKRARKDGRSSDQEGEPEQPQREPEDPVDVQSYIIKRMQETKAEVQKLGKSVMPPPPANHRTWETDTRETAEVIVKLVFEAQCLRLIIPKLAEAKDMNEEVDRTAEGRFLTPTEIDAWAIAIHNRLSKKEQDDIGWIKVEYGHDPPPPPEGENIHTVMPDGKEYGFVSPGHEFAWNVWRARESFIQEPKDDTSHAYWITGPGLTNEPFDRQVLARSKDFEIMKWSRDPVARRSAKMGQQDLQEYMLKRKEWTRRANEGDEQAIEDIKGIPSLTWAPDVETTGAEPSQPEPPRGRSSRRLAKAAAKTKPPWSKLMEKHERLLKPKDETRTADAL